MQVRLSGRGSIRSAGGSRTLVRLIDISVGGMTISYHTPLKVGSKFEVELALNINGVLMPMRLHGQIYQTYLSSDQFCSQLKFIDLKPQCAETIMDFLKYRLKLP